MGGKASAFDEFKALNDLEAKSAGPEPATNAGWKKVEYEYTTARRKRGVVVQLTMELTAAIDEELIDMKTIQKIMIRTHTKQMIIQK